MKSGGCTPHKGVSFSCGQEEESSPCFFLKRYHLKFMFTKFVLNPGSPLFHTGWGVKWFPMNRWGQHVADYQSFTKEKGAKSSSPRGNCETRLTFLRGGRCQRTQHRDVSFPSVVSGCKGSGHLLGSVHGLCSAVPCSSVSSSHSTEGPLLLLTPNLF